MKLFVIRLISRTRCAKEEDDRREKLYYRSVQKPRHIVV